MRIRLALFEDNDNFRESLVALLSTEPDITVVGAFPHCSAPFPEAVVALQPDVVLMDIHMPGQRNGIEATGVLKALMPDVQVVMLTVSEEDEIIFEALRRGATGYLLKRTAADELLDSIWEVMRGGSPITPAIARKVLAYFKGDNAPKPSESPALSEVFGLSAREREILEALMEGLSYKLIADRYFIATDTVRNHIQKIYQKMHVHSKGEAIHKASKFLKQ